MWTSIALITSVLFFFWTLTKGLKLKNRSLLFVALAIWLRYFLSAFHEVTFPPLLGGLSVNALVAIFVAISGIFILPIKIIFIKKLVPIYLFITCTFISAIVNLAFMGFITVVIKWLYFIAIAIHFLIALSNVKSDQAIKYILIPLSMPIVLQLISILLGYSKATESDGSISYIGGYNHEAVFSILVFTFLCMVSFIPKNKLQFKNLLIFISLFSIFLANYRTTLLACIPVLIFYMWMEASYSLVKSQRLVSSLFLSAGIVGLGLSFVMLFGERFSDIAVVVNQAGDLIKPAIYYSQTQQDIFSARVYYWSLYITEYVNSGLKTYIFGFGPDGWRYYFEKYAHNSFVSYLFEYGFIGLIFFVVLLMSPILGLLRLLQNNETEGTKSIKQLLACHMGFIILNLATMPLWQIEGSTLYALLMSITIYNQYTFGNNHTKGSKA